MSMTWEEATDALLSHFATQWAATQPTVPVEYPNTKPLSIDVETESFVRLTFVPSFSVPAALGYYRSRNGGRMAVRIFVPLGDGDGVAMGYVNDAVDIAKNAYTNGLSSEIILSPPRPIPGLRDNDIPAYRVGLDVPFLHYDQT